jgi:hypothetical protein
MEPLSNATREWLDDAVREEAIPSHDRARLWSAISSGIDVESTPSLLDRVVRLKHVVGIAALSLAAGIAIGHAVSPSPSSPPVARSIVVVPPAAPLASAVASPAPEPSTAPPPNSSVAAIAVPTTAARSAKANDVAMDEVRTIIRAKRALADGHPAEALTALEEHERAFPHGSLAEERDALRVLALCAEGRATEGAAERAAFLRAHPLSAYVDRVRAACVP